MVRRPLDKAGRIARTNETGDFLSAALVRIYPNGDVELDNPKARFLLNPASWQESKSVNWASQSVPGQSHPVKQWVNGGPRVVTFDALVTGDVNKNEATDPLANLIDSALNAVSDVASDFFNVTVPPLGDLFTGDSGGVDAHPLNIAPILDYYRALTLPVITPDDQLQSSPPLLALYVGSTVHNTFTETKDTLTKNGEVWILSELNINTTKQLPNLSPMEAIVSFKLEQYIINSSSSESYAASPKSSVTLPAINTPLGSINPGDFIA